MSEAAELIQVVTEMEERARAVPESVGRMAAAAAAYHAKVQAYVGRLDDKRERVEALKAQVNDALQALQDRAAEDRPVIEGGMKQVETAVEQARTAIDEAVDELAAALDKAAKAASTLRSELSEAAQRTATARADAGDALDALRGQLTSSQSSLDMFVGTAGNATDGVETAAEEAQETVVAGLEKLASTMLEYAEQHVGARLGRASEAFTGMVEAHESSLQTVMEALNASSQDMGRELQEELADKVSERLTKFAAGLGQDYDTLEQAHGKVEEAAGSEYREADLASARLTERNEVMAAQGVGAVKQGALKVGLDWPA